MAHTPPGHKKGTADRIIEAYLAVLCDTVLRIWSLC